jgi:hypothetical protein
MSSNPPHWTEIPIPFSLDLCAGYFSTEKGPYTCGICNEENMSLDALETHVNTQRHKTVYKDEYNRLQKKAQRYTDFFYGPLKREIRRVQNVRDLKQKQAIEAGLFRYLTAPASPNERDDDSAARRVQLEPAQKMLEQYECKERLVILALAVWKAQCLESLSTNGHTGLTSVLEYLKQWTQSGWKVHKAEHRNSSAIDIVVQAVIPFLPEKDS